MTIIFANGAAATLSKLQTRVRRAVGDTDTATSNQRWSDNEIIDAINLELLDLGSELGISNNDSALTSTTLSYTASASSTTLPAGPKSQPIFRVEDTTDSSLRPIPIDIVSSLEIERWADDYVSAHSARRSVCAIVGDTIMLRPKPSTARTLTIWYVRQPYLVAAESVATTAVSVSSNVATATVANHGFAVGMQISTTNHTTNVTDVLITAVTDTSISYPCVASDGAMADGVGTITSSANSQHSLPVGAEELISLGAAIRLQETDSEIPETRQSRYDRLRSRFVMQARKNRGPMYIRQNRRWA